MNRPPWKHRRRIIHLALLFCAFMVVWLVWRGEDSMLAATVVNACFFLAGSIIGAYVFGAAWDDRNVMQSAGLDAYDDEVPKP